MNQFQPPPPPRVDTSSVLIVGILSWVVCPLFGPFAWSMGGAALSRLDDRGIYDGNDRTMAQIGRVLGIVATILLLLPLALGALALGIAWATRAF